MVRDESGSLLGQQAITLVKRGGTYYASCAELRLHGTGTSAPEAIRALELQYDQSRQFEAASGLHFRDPYKGGALGTFNPTFFKTAAAVLLVTGLAAMQFGYAISSGIDRGTRNAGKALHDVNDRLVATLEEQFIRAGSSTDPMSSAREERLRAVARAIRNRYGPVLGELFGSVSPAAEPAAAARPSSRPPG